MLCSIHYIPNDVLNKLNGYVPLKSRCVSSPTDHSDFSEYDWIDFYEGAVEAIPPNAPIPTGMEVDLCMFVGSEAD